MTGEQLSYAPRWIKGDDLGERFDSGTIKRSILVLTVKSKQAADSILAKGLSFSGTAAGATKQKDARRREKAKHVCAAVAATTSTCAHKRRSASSARRKRRVVNISVLPKAAARHQNLVRITRRSVRTAKDHTWRNRASVLRRGRLVRHVCDSRMTKVT
jgi:hypothetical protein